MAEEDAAARAEALKNEGNEWFKKKKFRFAVDKYSQAIDANPTVPSYYTNRAFAYIKTEAFGAAINDANDALDLDKFFVKAYYRRASAFMGLMKFSAARRDYEAVLKLRPKDPDATKKYKEADKIVKRLAFEKAIAVDDGSKPLVEELRAKVDDIAVEDAYDGPRLEGDITLEFVQAMIARFKQEKTIHRKYAIKMLILMYDLLSALPSLTDVPIAPGGRVTVCGDVHGQFYDLLNIFELNGMPSPDNPYLFNGDFVDRGSFSTEVIFTLFGFRLLYPEHFFMSRGNHETINMNKMYGFEGEVKAKYTAQINDFFTDVYNWLPLGHVIHHKVLVVHGGLFSRDDVTLSELRKIRRNRQPPDEGLMCEMLFGPDVTAAFLENNDLQLLIRSHEVKDEGYEVMHGGKCITVFSAPNYCDQMGNKGAFIHLHEDCVPKFTQFEAVSHPNVKPMAYTSMMNMFGM